MRHNVNVNVIRPQLKIYEFSIFGNGHTTQYMPNMYNIGLASNESVCVWYFCGQQRKNHSTAQKSNVNGLMRMHWLFFVGPKVE